MTPDGDPAPRRILVVEDDAEVRYLLSVVLDGEDREVITVETAAEAEAVLEEDGVALVVLDLLLPDTDGRTLLRGIRARPATAGVPVVVASSRATAQIKADCFALGADAFWEKPFDPEVVATDVEGRLRWSAERARQDLTHERSGALNEAGVLRAMDALEGALRVLVLAEVDGVQRLSDRYGWETAERIVGEVAQAVGRVLPDEAALGRVGFGALAVVHGGGDGPALAEAVLDAARRLPVEGPDGETFRVTLSVGYLVDEGGREPAGLFQQVQGIVSRAREGGGNQVRTDATAGAREPGPILVAEDDDITARLLTHRMEKEGLDVLRFKDGASAYRGALETTPSLVILDVKMPGMDGFEVLERLRKTPSYADIPIVMLTSMGAESDVVRAFDLGADDYIMKPFSPAELLARVRRLAARGRSPAG